MKNVGYHKHPYPRVESVHGSILETGDILKEGDVYSSLTGKWEIIPQDWVGIVIVNDDSSTILIRPEPWVSAIDL